MVTCAQRTSGADPKIQGGGTMLFGACRTNSADSIGAGSVSVSLKTVRPVDQEFVFNCRC